jgi:hypothetical protein
VFSDPTVADALQRNVDKINATAMNSVERYRVIQKVLDEIVTPELIEKLRTSVDGIYQGLKSMIFDPDTGLFGLGRNFEKFGKRINQYGQYVDKAGNVVTDIAEAADEDLSLFEVVRDIFSNLGQALMPIVEVLPQIFDPLKNVAKVLMDVRHYAAEFNRTFNEYREGFKELAKIPGNEFLKESLDIRASLAAINNLFAEFGIITENEFLQTANMLKSKDLDIGATVSKMIDQFFDSDLAEKVGEIVGRVIGTVLSEVAKMTGFLADKVGGNKLTSGFKKGFEAAGGPKAFTAIFEDVFKLMFEGLKFVMKALPWQAYALMAAAVVLPAAISGLGMLIAQGIAGALSRALAGKAIEGHMGKAVQYIRSSILNFINSLKNVFSKNLRVVPAIVRDVTNEPKALPPGKTPGALPTAAIVPKVAKGMNAFTAFFGRIGPFLKGVGPRFLSFFKGFGGILTVVGGALTALIALFKGESLAQALAKGAGPVLGAALGAALIPFLGPIGPMIGALIGGAIGTSASVTEPLAQAFGDLGDSVRIVTNLFLQLGGDLQGLARGIPGVAKDFDLLRWTLSLLLSPITLLKIALLGIYEAYLNIKEKIPGGGLTPEEKADRDAAAAERRRAFAEYQNRMDPRSLSDQIKGVREDIAKTLKAPFGDQKKFETSVKGGKLPQSEKYFALQNRLKLLYEQEKATRREVGAKSVLGGKNVTWNGKQWVEASKTPTAPKPPAPKLPTAPKPPAPKLPTVPKTAAVAAPKAVQQTAANTTQLNQKAAQQVSAINATKNAASATKTATEATKNAVVAQKATLGTIQTTLSAMYGLLASGMLRVQTQMGMNGMLPGGFVPPGYIPPNLNPKKGQVSFPGIGESPKIGYQGHLGDAISQEMKHKPPGSDLVIANSSETIIPAKGLQVRSAWGGMNAAPMTVNTTVTINQQPGQDADALATIVAMKIGEAVADARASSLFV